MRRDAEVAAKDRVAWRRMTDGPIHVHSPQGDEETLAYLCVQMKLNLF